MLNDSDKTHMVLLPAMLCDEELYRPQIDGLGDLVDPVAMTVAEQTMAEATEAVLRQAPPRFVLGGTSYGGSLALDVVATAPSRVLALWLMGCIPGPHRDPAAALLRNHRVQRGEYDAVVEEIAATIVCDTGPRADQSSSSFRRMARRAGTEVFLRQNTSLLGRSDRRPDLAGIACPTMILWGQEDRLAGVEHGREMAGSVRGARLVVLENCGHLPTLEQPDATNAVVREWLEVIGVRSDRPQ